MWRPLPALAVFPLALALSCHPAVRTGAPGGPRPVRSNLLRGDYAGSAACAPCHGEIYEAWQRSPMHRMTRDAGHAEIAAPWDHTFHFKDDQAVLYQQDGARFLRIQSGRFGDHLFRVTRVIGGHHREDFAGREVGAGGPDERVLPVSYMLSSGTFRYKGYSVMATERPGLRPGGVWNRTCIFCHNTVPLLSTLLGALSGPGTPPYQGEVVDALLPPGRRQELVVTDPAGLRRAVADEVAVLRGRPDPALLDQPLPAVLKAAVARTRALFTGRDLIEVGIGCESCHGGSREHVQDRHARPVLGLQSPFLATRPALSHAQQINRVCARCHQVLFSRYPFTWEGGLRRAAGSPEGPGGSNVNSGEARDFLLGGCQGALSCTACHDPHAHDNQQRMRALEQGGGNAVCLGCHGAYRTPEALRAHTRHDPAGPGSQCLACHMPRKNMSLDTRLTRYHRIGSPTDPDRVLRDRPLECALCHADRSVSRLLTEMEALYPRGRAYDREAARRLYGDLDDNVMLATLSRGKPHEQAVAIAVLGEAGRRDAVPQLYLQLVHPYPLVRYYAKQALEQIAGTAAPFDLHQDNDRILAEARGWLEQAGLPLPGTVPKTTPPPGPAGDHDEE